MYRVMGLVGLAAATNGSTPGQWGSKPRDLLTFQDPGFPKKSCLPSEIKIPWQQNSEPSESRTTVYCEQDGKSYSAAILKHGEETYYSKPLQRDFFDEGDFFFEAITSQVPYNRISLVALDCEARPPHLRIVTDKSVLPHSPEPWVTINGKYFLPKFNISGDRISTSAVSSTKCSPKLRDEFLDKISSLFNKHKVIFISEVHDQITSYHLKATLTFLARTGNLKSFLFLEGLSADLKFVDSRGTEIHSLKGLEDGRLQNFLENPSLLLKDKVLKRYIKKKYPPKKSDENNEGKLDLKKYTRRLKMDVKIRNQVFVNQIVKTIGLDMCFETSRSYNSVLGGVLSDEQCPADLYAYMGLTSREIIGKAIVVIGAKHYDDLRERLREFLEE